MRGLKMILSGDATDAVDRDSQPNNRLSMWSIKFDVTCNSLLEHVSQRCSGQQMGRKHEGKYRDGP